MNEAAGLYLLILSFFGPYGTTESPYAQMFLDPTVCDAIGKMKQADGGTTIFNGAVVPNVTYRCQAVKLL